MSRPVTLRLGAALFGSLAFTAALGASTPAQAASAITCAGSGTLKWGTALPGTETDEDWSATTKFSGCSGIGVDGDATAPKQLTASGSEEADCTGPVTNDKGTVNITWADGTQGTGTDGIIYADELNGNPLGIFTITITGGAHHVGQTMVETAVTGLDGSCGESSVNYGETSLTAMG